MPNDFRNAMRILFSGKEWAIKRLLPVPMKAIKSSANTCLKEAIKVKDKFDGVKDLLRELIIVATASKGAYERKLLIAKVSFHLSDHGKLKMDSNFCNAHYNS